MTPCGDTCHREAQGNESYTSPPVSDEEWVCRSVQPKGYNATGILKSGFVHAKRLKEGWLSAWRVAEPAALQTIEHKMSDEGVLPANVVAAKALTLRAIRIGGERAVCVINDTRTSEHGDHDELHIAVSGCARFMPWTDEAKSIEDFEELRAKILLAFRSEGIALHPVTQS